MEVEKNLASKFQEYKNQECELEQYKENAYRSNVGIIITALFEAHHIGLISLLIYLCVILAKADSSGAAPAIVAVFGGAGLIAWLIISNKCWFTRSDYSWGRDQSWMESVVDYINSFHNSKNKVKILKAEQNKREEFFKFYELYQSDETFKDSYNKSVTRQDEQKEFLDKLNKNN